MEAIQMARWRLPMLIEPFVWAKPTSQQWVDFMLSCFCHETTIITSCYFTMILTFSSGRIEQWSGKWKVMPTNLRICVASCVLSSAIATPMDLQKVRKESKSIYLHSGQWTENHWGHVDSAELSNVFLWWIAKLCWIVWIRHRITQHP